MRHVLLGHSMHHVGTPQSTYVDLYGNDQSVMWPLDVSQKHGENETYKVLPG